MYIFYYYFTISLFSGISGYECAERQERYTTHPNTTILNDNTGCDLNTAAGRATNCNPVKPTESPVMNSDKCDGAVRVDLKCDKNIKSTINASAADKSPSVKLVKSQDSKHLATQSPLVHSGILTDENIFMCTICAKVCLTHEHLTAHTRTHDTDERPFPCTLCDTSFTTQSNLTAHVRNHTGEKPYACETCGQQFRQKGTLTVHSRIHTGEKPYPCTLCDKKFIQRSSLNWHMKKKH